MQSAKSIEYIKVVDSYDLTKSNTPNENLESTDSTVIKKMADISPQHITYEQIKYWENGGCLRRQEDFDPNVFFNILTNLCMKPGYTLDYIYAYTYMGGQPHLYARKVDSQPFKTPSEYYLWEKSNDLITYLVLDETPDSYLQLALFQKKISQFYLYWHASMEYLEIYSSDKDFKKVIKAIHKGECDAFGRIFSQKDLDKLLSLSVEPCVLLTGKKAKVIFYAKSDNLPDGNPGLIRTTMTFLREKPYTLLNSDDLVLFSYFSSVTL